MSGATTPGNTARRPSIRWAIRRDPGVSSRPPVLRGSGAVSRVIDVRGGRAMAKGQVRGEKSNKPKLSPKEKAAKKAEKKAAKGKK